MTAAAPATATVALPPVAPVATWPTLTDLSSDASQRVFHQVMEAFSRPGTLHELPESAVHAPAPAAIVPLLALVDLMTPLASVTAQPGAATATEADVETARDAVGAIARLTGAPVAKPSQARFALALDASADFSDLNPGSHWSPEQGAMLVQRVAAISTGSAPGAWKLTGPGVAPHTDTMVRIDGLSESWVRTRAGLVADYPAGIDCLLVTDDGEFVALPRTTTIEVI